MNWITKIALKKRWLTILVSLLLAGVSIWATITLKMELLPDVELPLTTVLTVYPQAQPEEVLNEVTMPVEQVIADINETRPDILWIGLGAPKQEVWMLNHYGKINAAAMVGVGAAFDFHSEKVKWAPAAIRCLGLEWAWRLGLNPRMWHRNIDSFIFLAKVIQQRLTKKNGRATYACQNIGQEEDP